MTELKRAINTALAKTTGHRLVRVRQDMDPQDSGPSTRRSARQREQRPARRRRKRRLAEVRRLQDPEAYEIIRRVRPRTMTSEDKLYGLVLACRHIARHRVPGDVVECGVWRGGSMQAAALTLLAVGDTERHLHLFDTFEGMPPPSDQDRRAVSGVSAATILERSQRDQQVWAVADLDDVQRGMAEVDYPSERVHFHKGLVEQTTPHEAPGSIALLRLDTDWYESTRHELEHLYPRLSPGGVLIIDDYSDWEGARKAADEYFDALDQPVLLLPLGGGRIAVKPS